MSRKMATPSMGYTAALTLLMVLAACSRQHAEGADTVTNWLRSCQQSSDCTGEAVCLNALCSLPCSEAASTRCEAIHASASCELSAGACDLSCQTSRTCLDLGARFTCFEGHCRESDDASASSSDDGQDGETVASDGARPPSAAGGGPGSISSEASFDPGTRVELSDHLVTAGTPRAMWQADHWQVAWPVPLPGMLGSGIAGAAIFPDGKLELKSHGNESGPLVTAVVNGPDGTVAHVERVADSCTLLVSDFDTGRSREPRRFGCELFQPALAPVPGSDEWVLSWLESGAADPLQKVIMVARYDPGAPDFIGGAKQIATGYANRLDSLGLAVSDAGDVWAWGPSPTPFIDGVYRVRGWARPEGPPAFAIDRFDVTSGGIHSLTPIADDVRVFESVLDDTTLRTIALDASGATRSTRDLSLPEQVPPKLTHIPEHKLFAVCVVKDDLGLIFLDEQGAALSERIVIERGEGELMPVGCDVAWSGSALLVVWTTVDVGDPNLPLQYGGPVGTVQAKIVPVPALPR